MNNTNQNLNRINIKLKYAFNYVDSKILHPR